MDFTMDQSAFFDDQQQFMQSQPTPFQHSPVGALPNTNGVPFNAMTIERERPNQSYGHWQTGNFGYSRPIYQQHWSASTHSSTSSHARSSDNSIFSHLQNRASTVSNDSSLSSISNLSRNHYLSQAEHSLTGQSSPLSSYTSSPIEAPVPRTSRKRNVLRTAATEKDYYKTCVSRRPRARRAETVQKYFCTVCKEPFAEKADWRRHEETYQERPEEFQCDLCQAKYFLDKDFVNHHVQGHGCAHCFASNKCSSKKHVEEARKPRKRRTGWGCGFCYHFTQSWTERCNHIAHHFDLEGKTMADWNHSSVIYSLLQRPAVLRKWNAVLESKKRAFIGFGWDPQSTARVEGYPDSNQTLQLQDALEFFTPDQDSAALAHKAFALAVKKVARQAPEIAPPVPPKDYRVNHKASLQDIMNETESWTQFVKSIINDDQLPTGVTHIENGTLDDDFNSWFDPSF